MPLFGLHANLRSVREILRLLLPIVGAAAMVAVALLSGSDRVGQVSSGIAAGCLVWAAVAVHRRQNRADARPSSASDNDVVRGPRAL